MVRIGALHLTADCNTSAKSAPRHQIMSVFGEESVAEHQVKLGVFCTFQCLLGEVTLNALKGGGMRCSLAWVHALSIDFLIRSQKPWKDEN